ncbi:MAG: ADP-ribosylation factor-like protein [Candidatus Hodarchaeales archaeon]
MFPSPIRKKRTRKNLERVQEKKSRIDMEKENRFKVVVCGDAAVGKTTLINRHMLGEFTPHTRPTPGINMVDEPVVLKSKYGDDSGIAIEGQISYWDLGGQKMFHQLRKMYLAGANGVMLCFSLNDEQSLLEEREGSMDQSIGVFLQELINALGKDMVKEVPFILCGTKSDLGTKIDVKVMKSVVRSLRKAGLNIVSWEKDHLGVQVFGKFALDPWEKEKWMNGQGYIPTSSKTGENIENAFEIMKIALFNAQKRKMMDLIGPSNYQQHAALTTSMRATAYSSKETETRKKIRYRDRYSI